MASSSKKIRRKLWVVKAGSQLICAGGPLLIRGWMQQVATLRRKHGVDIVWVTSGAIASAIDRTGFSRKKTGLAGKQGLSAIGQPLILDLYNLGLQSYGLWGAQVLLTYDDLASSKRRQNFQNTIEQLLRWGVTPILNENDAVATEEIQFGDNDSLSAKVAKHLNADRLVILTDVDGLYDADPTSHEEARLIPRVRKVDASVLALATSHSSSGRGRGGMRSKLLAAKEAGAEGIDTWLVKGSQADVLLDVLKNKPVGTFFLGQKKLRQQGSRKRVKRK